MRDTSQVNAELPRTVATALFKATADINRDRATRGLKPLPVSTVARHLIEHALGRVDLSALVEAPVRVRARKAA